MEAFGSNKIFTIWAIDLCYTCAICFAALFEIVMDNSKTPIVLYKEPEPNTSNAVTESDTQSTLNELCEENTSEGNQKDSGYTTGK